MWRASSRRLPRTALPRTALARTALARTALPRPAVPRTARRGVTLLEALAALAIVGTTSISVLALASDSARTTERARRALEVEALADELLARFTLARLESSRGLPDSLTAGRFAPPFDEYTWIASATPSATLPGLTAIDVEVRWPEGAQRFATELFRRPLRVDSGVR